MYAGFVMTLKSSKAGYELTNTGNGSIVVVLLWCPSYVKYILMYRESPIAMARCKHIADILFN